MEMKKVLKIITIIGVILIVLGPILGFALNKVTIVSRGPENPIVIPETSTTSIRDAFAQDITITKNQKMIIEFSLFYPNVSATLIILGKGTFDYYFALDSAPPGSGLTFIYSQFTWGEYVPNTVVPANSRSISNEGYWYIEFAGGVSGISLISRPGIYVVVIYGVNTGPPAYTNVMFDLNVKVDGPGGFLNTLFLTIGIILLAVAAILLSYSYLNKLRRGID
ncbi:MAG: hypothetical protein ACFFA2_08720 [Promethearchaeota archaeon]